MATSAAARAQPAFLNQNLISHLRWREVDVDVPNLLQSKQSNLRRFCLVVSEQPRALDLRNG